MKGKKHRDSASAAPRKLTHLDDRGRIRMVDVGDKPVTQREAIARAAVRMEPATLEAIIGGSSKRVKRSPPRASPASWPPNGPMN